jgi:microcystin-dependent protein
LAVQPTTCWLLHQELNMASIINAGTTTSTALNVTTDTTGAMVLQTSGANAISISNAQVVTLANALLPASGGTGITSLGTGVATFLGTPSSANLAAAVTDETGTGSLVFAASPTLSGTPLAPTAAVGTNTTQIATTAFVQAAGLVGEIKMWGTASAPTGYLLCDGSSVSTTTYAALFAVIGYTFGGSGASFTLPDYRGKMPIGVSGSYALASTGGAATTTLITANLPSHTHSITDPGHTHGLTNLATASDTVSGGGITIQTRTNSPNTTNSATTGITATDATGSGTAATTISPYLAINFIIKT